MQSPLRTPMKFPEQEKKASPMGEQRTWFVPAVIVGVVALIGMFVIFTWGSGQVAEANRQKAHAEGQLDALRQQSKANPTPLATPTPACDDFTAVIESVRRAIGDGNFSTAVQFVNVALASNTLPPCPRAKLTLAGLGYSASLDQLFSSPGLDGHTAFLGWQAAEQNADGNQLPKSSRWPAIQVVTLAYNAGFWELAQAAFARGWVDASTNHSDPKMLDLYYAVLRNWGHALARGSDEMAHRQGLVLLRTAEAVGKAFHLPRGEAHQDLVELLGPDEVTWPLPDYSDPILATARSMEGAK
jgi:hypothetical protein